MATKLILDSPIHDRRSLRQEVYQRLKEAIIEGQLRPGEHLVESKIAERLGVSRVPVREAMLALEREDLVCSSGKGMVVSSFSREGIEQVYAVRAALEALGATLAAEHITPKEKQRLLDILSRSRRAVDQKDTVALTEWDIEFHDVLIGASHNATLKRMLEQLRDSVRRFRTASIALPGRPEEVLKDHTEIAQVVISGDTERAGALARKHVLEAARRLLDSIQGTIQ